MISVDSSNLRKLSDMHKAACNTPPYAKTDTERYKVKEKKEKRTNYGRKES